MTIAQLCDHFEQRELSNENTWRSHATKKIYKAYLTRWIRPHLLNLIDMGEQTTYIIRWAHCPPERRIGFFDNSSFVGPLKTFRRAALMGSSSPLAYPALTRPSKPTGLAETPVRAGINHFAHAALRWR
jgi:hypothetical protein